MKYMRRPDLTILIRAKLALEALVNKGKYGYITELTKSYKVSITLKEVKEKRVARYKEAGKQATNTKAIEIYDASHYILYCALLSRQQGNRQGNRTTFYNILIKKNFYH